MLIAKSDFRATLDGSGPPRAMSRGYDYHKPRSRNSLRRDTVRERWRIILLLLGGGCIIAVLLYLNLSK